MNNGKMFRCHGAIGSTFVKGKRDWFNSCIANKISTLKQPRGKGQAISCQKPTRQCLVPLPANYFLGFTSYNSP